VAQRREPAGEGARIGERSVLTEELQPPGAMKVVELFEEAAPKQPRQHAHGQEEARPAADPAFTVW
jgi:hypothetical protein